MCHTKVTFCQFSSARYKYSFLTVYHIADSDITHYFTVIAGYKIYSLLQKMLVAVAKLKKCARFYFGNDMFASKSNEVESR